MFQTIFEAGRNETKYFRLTYTNFVVMESNVYRTRNELVIRVEGKTKGKTKIMHLSAGGELWKILCGVQQEKGTKQDEHCSLTTPSTQI